MTTSHSQKLTALRVQMKKLGVDGFLVPRISEYQGEFVADYAERLAWLTGFDGSAGTAVVLRDKAAILTDGRYTIQLAQQADKKLYEFVNSQKISVSKWIAENAKAGWRIGYDPWLLTARQVEQMGRTLEEAEIEFVPVKKNLVDAVWEDRPGFPSGSAEIFPENFAGLSAAEKIKNVCVKLKEKKLSACVITMPDSLAWLLNIRGSDVEHTPVVLSFGIVHADGRVEWFVDVEKIPADVKKHLGKKVEIVPPMQIAARVKALAAGVKKAKKKAGLDYARAPIWFKQALGAAAVDFKDPCIDPKAVKTGAEQDALRAAHIRDGAALVNFLCWLEGQKNGLTEISVAEKLESFRRKNNSYRGPSFSTICGWAANGAIVHYRATEKTNAAIKGPGILLLDSGGQYNDGTTDITRTIAIGKPTTEMRERFTLVLKGHIALARAKFPEGTAGAQLDTLARQPLWAEGLDYSHGTGHGVGCFLSVHEESASISPRGNEIIRAGMFVSNEPGYYKEGAYGIRIENLVLVREEGKAEAGQKILGFETLSLVPIDRALIKKDMLSAEELNWVNDYHATVLKVIGPRVEGDARVWLVRAGAAL